jgi:hypothetical protein
MTAVKNLLSAMPQKFKLFKLFKLFKFLDRFMTLIRHEAEPWITPAGAKS